MDKTITHDAGKPQRPVSSLDAHSDKFRRRMRSSFGRHPAANASSMYGKVPRHDDPRHELVPGSRSYGSRSAVKMGLLFSDPGIFAELNCLLVQLWSLTPTTLSRDPLKAIRAVNINRILNTLGHSLGRPHHRTRKCSGTIFRQSTVTTTAMALHTTEQPNPHTLAGDRDDSAPSHCSLPCLRLVALCNTPFPAFTLQAKVVQYLAAANR